MRVNYRYEYFPNPEYVAIHFATALTDSEQDITDYTSSGATEQDKELLAVVAGVEGVKRGCINGIRITRYTITVTVGEAFDREEVTNEVRDTVVMVLMLRRRGEIELNQLPTIRGDILGHECEQCKAEREEMYRNL